MKIYFRFFFVWCFFFSVNNNRKEHRDRESKEQPLFLLFLRKRKQNLSRARVHLAKWSTQKNQFCWPPSFNDQLKRFFFSLLNRLWNVCEFAGSFHSFHSILDFQKKRSTIFRSQIKKQNFQNSI